MSNAQLSYMYIFFAVMTFSVASLGYAYFAKKVSPLWIAVFKNIVAFLATIVALPLVEGWGSLGLDVELHWPFLLSGVIGLAFADLLLMSAFRLIGPGRTLLLFGLQPVLTGFASYYFWGETLHGLQVLSVFFFILCLLFFSFEQIEKTGEWEWRGLAFALAAIVLDAAGVVLTKFGFSQGVELSGLQVNYLRLLASLLAFSLFAPFLKVGLWGHLSRLSRKEIAVAVAVSLSGTFLSLVCYMEAIRYGKLATVTSIVLVDPMIATFLECWWFRLWPSRWLWRALLAFACAMVCLVAAQF